MVRYPHCIRLRGPWHHEVLNREAAGCGSGDEQPNHTVGTTGRVKMPCDWGDSLGSDFRGAVRFTRSFNLPSGLDPHEHVWLVCHGADARARWRLNGRKLPDIQGYALPCEANVSGLLEPHNRLEVDVELSGDDDHEAQRPGRQGKPGGLIGLVHVEIRAEQWIEELSVEPFMQDQKAALQLSGRIAGTEHDRKLDVSVNLAEREIAYIECPVGERFQVIETVDDAPRWPAHLSDVTVRCIADGPRVWQTTRSVGFRQVDLSSEPSPALSVDSIELPPIPWPILDLANRESPDKTTEEKRIFLSGRTFFSAEIWPESTYVWLDQLGVRLIQFVPSEWIDRVCPRLAHHASVVAWASEIQSDQLRASLGHRPWLSASSARDTNTIPVFNSEA